MDVRERTDTILPVTADIAQLCILCIDMVPPRPDGNMLDWQAENREPQGVMSGAIPGPCDAGIAASASPCACRYPRATLAATVLGSSVAFIDGSVVNVALPALARDLGASPEGLSWTINAYLLPLGALILLGGGAGDHFGRRRLFLLGLAIFTSASILCAAAPALSWLLLGRGLQGLGAALLMPNSLAILGSSFSGEARGQAIGTWAAAGALAGALGPLLGGWLVDTAGWRTIFVINVPVAAGAAYLAWAYVAESTDGRRSGSLDWAGAGFATAGLGLVTWSLTAASEAGVAPAVLWGTAAAGFVFLGVFVWLEGKRGERAIMPLAMFATPAFIGLTLFTFFLYGSLGGLLVLLPFLLIKIEGWPAVSAGSALLPLPILIGLGSRVMGRLTSRYGGRFPLAAGAAIVAIGLMQFAWVSAGGFDYWSDILPATFLVGIGMGISVAPLTTAVMASVDTGHTGAASGFNSAAARVAGLIATALLGFVFALQGNAGTFIAGFRVAAMTGAALAAAAAACALLFIRARVSPASTADRAV
jgi:EmrB/QacA subfamily drug resistance transporter